MWRLANPSMRRWRWVPTLAARLRFLARLAVCCYQEHVARSAFCMGQPRNLCITAVQRTVHFQDSRKIAPADRERADKECLIGQYCCGAAVHAEAGENDHDPRHQDHL